MIKINLTLDPKLTEEDIDLVFAYLIAVYEEVGDDVEALCQRVNEDREKSKEKE